MTPIVVWYFLMAGWTGGFAAQVWMQAGPFVSQEQCEEIRDSIVRKGNEQKSKCWSVPR